MPCNDHPSDKATFDMELTAPTGLEVVSNGRLRGTDDNDDGTSTWRWQVTEPMATYLATMNIGEFDTTAEVIRDTLELGVSHDQSRPRR